MSLDTKLKLLVSHTLAWSKIREICASCPAPKVICRDCQVRETRKQLSKQVSNMRYHIEKTHGR